MTKENEFIVQVVDRYGGDTGMLIPMMQDVQAELGYLPSEQLRYLGRRLEVPVSRIYAVATFYSSFRLAPKGAHEVTLCHVLFIVSLSAKRCSRSYAVYGHGMLS